MANIEPEKRIRIGMVNYINTAPIYEIWKKEVVDKKYEMVERPPSVLNKMLASGSIDLGFVSSYEYSARPLNYRILDDLSISATGSVGSVFLFSQLPLEKLDKKLILLSNQSETSVSLVKIILEEFCHIKPLYISGDISGTMQESCHAVMAIGDDALRLVSSGLYDYQFDLGDIWHKFTDMPFVFSVCAVRESFCKDYADEVRKIQHLLLSCRTQGAENLHEVCSIVAPRIPMDIDKCRTYLTGLQYDLDTTKKKALEKFFGFLIKRGEAAPGALPLRLFS